MKGKSEPARCSQCGRLIEPPRSWLLIAFAILLGISFTLNVILFWNLYVVAYLMPLQQALEKV